MKKRIHMLLLLLLTVLCLGGCGRQGKISNKLFEQALDGYQKYFREMVSETDDDCYILLSLDITGLPAVMIATEKEISSYSYSYSQTTIGVYTFGKKGVVPLLEKKLDESDDFALYSDGIVSITHENETVWYQVKKGNLEEIAYSDNSEYAVFHTGKKDIEIDLEEEDPLIYEKVYEKICKNLYGQKNMGMDYGKDMWLQQLKGIERLNHPTFLQSPALGGTMDMCDPSDFRKLVSRLKQQGSMNNDEFLVWYYNSLVDFGVDEPVDYLCAASLVFRNPLLLNEIDNFMTKDKERSLLYLLSYLEHTRDWKMAEKIELLEDVGRSYLEQLQLLSIYDNAASIIAEKKSVFDRYLTSLVIYLYDNSMGIEERFDIWFYDWPQQIEEQKRPLEDLLFKEHAKGKVKETYNTLADKKNNIAYIRSCMELIDKLPQLTADWKENYLGSEQMERDYEEYVKDRYVAYIEEGNSIFFNADSVNEGYAFFKIGEEKTPYLIKYYQRPDINNSKHDAIILMAYYNNQVSEYGLNGSSYWVDEVNGFYTDIYFGRAVYSYVLWTLKNGNPYILEGKHADYYNSWPPQFFLIEEGDAIITEDLFTFGAIGATESQISEQEYQRIMSEYADMTKLPKFVEPDHISDKYEQGQAFCKTYPTIEEAFDAYLKNPTGEIEVLTIESDETYEVIISDETTEEIPMVQQSEVPLDINVDEKVTQIRAWFTETQSNLNSYSSKDDGDVLKYYDNGNLCKMVVDKGYHNWNYAREYYFQGGELYFAFVFDGSEEHRLYFKDNQLIRYIDENKSIYDYGDTDQFSDWSVPVISEAYDLSQ